MLIGMQNLDLVQRTWANQDPVDMASCIHIGEERRRLNSRHVAGHGETVAFDNGSHQLIKLSAWGLNAQR